MEWPTGPVQSGMPMNEAKFISDCFVRYLADFPKAEAVADCERVRARAGAALVDAHGMAELARVLRGAATAGRPFSAVRIGDGEGNVLASAEPDQAELRQWAFGRILENMFGRDDFAPPLRERLRVLLEDAVLDADLIGLRTPDNLARSYEVAGQRLAEGRKIKNVRGLVGNVDSVRMVRKLLDGAGRRPPWVADFGFHLALLPDYGAILGGLDFLGVVGRSAELAGRLQAAFGVATCRGYVTPGQAKGEFRSDHFPDVFDRLCEEMEVPYPGAVFLVGAGILGKAYCAVLKAKGAAAIDVGSAMDVWLGDQTRRSITADVVGRWKLDG
jgi:hypothetical protein